MSYYAPSASLDSTSATPTVISQPTFQTPIFPNIASLPVQYPMAAQLTVPNAYMYGSYPQPMNYGYGQSMPMYVQYPQQATYSMQSPYTAPSYGYGAMTTQQYMPSMGMSMVADPYRYVRYGCCNRPRRRRRRYPYFDHGSSCCW